MFAKHKLLGTFTADKIGNSIKVTIPAAANIEAGTLLEAFLESDDCLVYQPKSEKNQNFWDSDFVQNHDFEHDKAIFSELQGHRIGKE